MKKRRYWSSVFAMLGVALIATAFFQGKHVLSGIIFGSYCLYWGYSIYEEDA